MQRALGLATLAAMASTGPPGNKRESFALCAFNLPHWCCSAVLVQLFQWSWDNIAQVNPTLYRLLCTNVIFIDDYPGVHPIPGSCRLWFRSEYDISLAIYIIWRLHAYDAPIASPPQEHIIGDAWWVDYQVGE